MGSNGVNGAYVVLLTSPSYVIGVEVLQWSLQSVNSIYPLVVLYTGDTVTDDSVQILKKAGCIMKEVERIRRGPGNEGSNSHLAQSYYDDVWTKFHVFNLTEFSQVVCLDADMLVRKNLDELMTLELPDENWLAASPACLCNPMKISTYPKHWVPEICSYTSYTRKTCASGLEIPVQADSTGYFNSGTFVLRPSENVYAQLISRLQNPAVAKYPFPDQDVLNEVFAGKWIQLSYAYNALKTLRSGHSQMWNDSEIKIVHYILQKPWVDLTWSKLGEAEKKTRAGTFYEVNTWWFQAYEAMVNCVNGKI